jgi:hypothetical protein
MRGPRHPQDESSYLKARDPLPRSKVFLGDLFPILKVIRVTLLTATTPTASAVNARRDRILRVELDFTIGTRHLKPKFVIKTRGLMKSDLTEVTEELSHETRHDPHEDDYEDEREDLATVRRKLLVSAAW